MKPEYEAYKNELIEERKNSVSWGIDESKLTEAMIVRYQCTSFALKFIAKFPHLRKQSGWCNGVEHNWCVDIDGTYVDPTAAQFSEPRIYRELDPEKDEIYLGCCVNCGESIYGLMSEGQQIICSDECADSYNRYIEWEAARYNSGRY